MAKKSAKLGWSDTEEIAFLLIDAYPKLDPSKLSASRLTSLVSNLPGFGDKSKPETADLEAIQETWYEERSEMEDELGPFGPLDEDSELDEEIYRDDRMVEDSDDSDDTEEVSLDDAFGDEDEDPEEEEF